jgi:hypothetical protein
LTGYRLRHYDLQKEHHMWLFGGLRPTDELSVYSLSSMFGFIKK